MINSMSNRLTPKLIFLALLCAAASTASATTYLWDGSFSTSWSAKQNWTPQTTPTSTDLAQFNAVPGNLPDVTAAATVGGLQFVATAGAFTISGAGPLTINSGITNATTTAANSQTLSVTSIILGNNQNWQVSGAGSTVVSAGTTVNLSTHTLTVDGNGTGATTMNGILSSGSLTKSGTSPLALNNSGNTLVNLSLNGGTATLGAAQTLSGALNLGGGTLAANNKALTAAGALNVTAPSAITLTGTGSQDLHFDSATSNGSLLTINNWTGPAYQAGVDNTGGTAERIFITSQPDGTFLNNVLFTGYPQGSEWLNGTGELVPVPEPATYAAIFALGLLGFAFARRQMFARA
jgi:hypothetical protein